MFQTRDGKTFEREELAIAYLDNQMGGILTRHAGQLIHFTKYSEILEYLEEALPEFAKARELQSEIQQAKASEFDAY